MKQTVAERIKQFEAEAKGSRSPSNAIQQSKALPKPSEGGECNSTFTLASGKGREARDIRPVPVHMERKQTEIYPRSELEEFCSVRSDKSNKMNEYKYQKPDSNTDYDEYELESLVECDSQITPSTEHNMTTSVDLCGGNTWGEFATITLHKNFRNDCQRSTIANDEYMNFSSLDNASVCLSLTTQSPKSKYRSDSVDLNENDSQISAQEKTTSDPNDGPFDFDQHDIDIENNQLKSISSGSFHNSDRRQKSGWKHQIETTKVIHLTSETGADSTIVSSWVTSRCSESAWLEEVLSSYTIREQNSTTQRFQKPRIFRKAFSRLQCNRNPEEREQHSELKHASEIMEAPSHSEETFITSLSFSSFEMFDDPAIINPFRDMISGAPSPRNFRRSRSSESLSTIGATDNNKSRRRPRSTPKRRKRDERQSPIVVRYVKEMSRAEGNESSDHDSIALSGLDSCMKRSEALSPECLQPITQERGGRKSTTMLRYVKDFSYVQLEGRVFDSHGIICPKIDQTTSLFHTSTNESLNGSSETRKSSSKQCNRRNEETLTLSQRKSFRSFVEVDNFQEGKPPTLFSSTDIFGESGDMQQDPLEPESRIQSLPFGNARRGQETSQVCYDTDAPQYSAAVFNYLRDYSRIERGGSFDSGSLASWTSTVISSVAPTLSANLYHESTTIERKVHVKSNGNKLVTESSGRFKANQFRSLRRSIDSLSPGEGTVQSSAAIFHYLKDFSGGRGNGSFDSASMSSAPSAASDQLPVAKSRRRSSGADHFSLRLDSSPTHDSAAIVSYLRVFTNMRSLGSFDASTQCTSTSTRNSENLTYQSTGSDSGFPSISNAISRRSLSLYQHEDSSSAPELIQQSAAILSYLQEFSAVRLNGSFDSTSQFSEHSLLLRGSEQREGKRSLLKIPETSDIFEEISDEANPFRASKIEAPPHCMDQSAPKQDVASATRSTVLKSSNPNQYSSAVMHYLRDLTGVPSGGSFDNASRRSGESEFTEYSDALDLIGSSIKDLGKERDRPNSFEFVDLNIHHAANSEHQTLSVSGSDFEAPQSRGILNYLKASKGISSAGSFDTSAETSVESECGTSTGHLRHKSLAGTFPTKDLFSSSHQTETSEVPKDVSPASKFFKASLGEISSVEINVSQLSNVCSPRSSSKDSEVRTHAQDPPKSQTDGSSHKIVSGGSNHVDMPSGNQRQSDQQRTAEKAHVDVQARIHTQGNRARSTKVAETPIEDAPQVRCRSFDPNKSAPKFAVANQAAQQEEACASPITYSSLEEKQMNSNVMGCNKITMPRSHKRESLWLHRDCPNDLDNPSAITAQRNDKHMRRKSRFCHNEKLQQIEELLGSTPETTNGPIGFSDENLHCGSEETESVCSLKGSVDGSKSRVNDLVSLPSSPCADTHSSALEEMPLDFLTCVREGLEGVSDIGDAWDFRRLQQNANEMNSSTERKPDDILESRRSTPPNLAIATTVSVSSSSQLGLSLPATSGNVVHTEMELRVRSNPQSNTESVPAYSHGGSAFCNDTKLHHQQLEESLGLSPEKSVDPTEEHNISSTTHSSSTNEAILLSGSEETEPTYLLKGKGSVDGNESHFSDLVCFPSSSTAETHTIAQERVPPIISSFAGGVVEGVDYRRVPEEADAGMLNWFRCSPTRSEAAYVSPSSPLGKGLPTTIGNQKLVAYGEKELRMRSNPLSDTESGKATYPAFLFGESTFCNDTKVRHQRLEKSKELTQSFSSSEDILFSGSEGTESTSLPNGSANGNESHCSDLVRYPSSSSAETQSHVFPIFSSFWGGVVEGKAVVREAGDFRRVPEEVDANMLNSYRASPTKSKIAAAAAAYGCTSLPSPLGRGLHTTSRNRKQFISEEKETSTKNNPLGDTESGEAALPTYSLGGSNLCNATKLRHQQHEEAAELSHGTPDDLTEQYSISIMTQTSSTSEAILFSGSEGTEPTYLLKGKGSADGDESRFSDLGCFPSSSSAEAPSPTQGRAHLAVSSRMGDCVDFRRVLEEEAERSLSTNGEHVDVSKSNRGSPTNSYVPSSSGLQKTSENRKIVVSKGKEPRMRDVGHAGLSEASHHSFLFGVPTSCTDTKSPRRQLEESLGMSHAKPGASVGQHTRSPSETLLFLRSEETQPAHLLSGPVCGSESQYSDSVFIPASSVVETLSVSSEASLLVVDCSRVDVKYKFGGDRNLRRFRGVQDVLESTRERQPASMVSEVEAKVSPAIRHDCCAPSIDSKVSAVAPPMSPSVEGISSTAGDSFGDKTERVQLKTSETHVGYTSTSNPRANQSLPFCDATFEITATSIDENRTTSKTESHTREKVVSTTNEGVDSTFRLGGAWGNPQGGPAVSSLTQRLHSASVKEVPTGVPPWTNRLWHTPTADSETPIVAAAMQSSPPSDEIATSIPAPQKKECFRTDLHSDVMFGTAGTTIDGNLAESYAADKQSKTIETEGLVKEEEAFNISDPSRDGHFELKDLSGKDEVEDRLTTFLTADGEKSVLEVVGKQRLPILSDRPNEFDPLEKHQPLVTQNEQRQLLADSEIELHAPDTGQTEPGVELHLSGTGSPPSRIKSSCCHEEDRLSYLKRAKRRAEASVRRLSVESTVEMKGIKPATKPDFAPNSPTCRPLPDERAQLAIGDIQPKLGIVRHLTELEIALRRVKGKIRNVEKNSTKASPVQGNYPLALNASGLYNAVDSQQGDEGIHAKTIRASVGDNSSAQPDNHTKRPDGPLLEARSIHEDQKQVQHMRMGQAPIRNRGESLACRCPSEHYNSDPLTDQSSKLKVPPTKTCTGLEMISADSGDSNDIEAAASPVQGNYPLAPNSSKVNDPVDSRQGDDEIHANTMGAFVGDTSSAQSDCHTKRPDGLLLEAISMHEAQKQVQHVRKGQAPSRDREESLASRFPSENYSSHALTDQFDKLKIPPTRTCTGLDSLEHTSVTISADAGDSSDNPVQGKCPLAPNSFKVHDPVDSRQGDEGIYANTIGAFVGDTSPAQSDYHTKRSDGPLLEANSIHEAQKQVQHVRMGQAPSWDREESLAGRFPSENDNSRVPTDQSNNLEIPPTQTCTGLESLEHDSMVTSAVWGDSSDSSSLDESTVCRALECCSSCGSTIEVSADADWLSYWESGDREQATHRQQTLNHDITFLERPEATPRNADCLASQPNRESPTLHARDNTFTKCADREPNHHRQPVVGEPRWAEEVLQCAEKEEYGVHEMQQGIGQEFSTSIEMKMPFFFPHVNKNDKSKNSRHHSFSHQLGVDSTNELTCETSASRHEKEGGKRCKATSYVEGFECAEKDQDIGKRQFVTSSGMDFPYQNDGNFTQEVAAQRTSASRHEKEERQGHNSSSDESISVEKLKRIFENPNLIKSTHICEDVPRKKSVFREDDQAHLQNSGSSLIPFHGRTGMEGAFINSHERASASNDLSGPCHQSIRSESHDLTEGDVLDDARPSERRSAKRIQAKEICEMMLSEKATHTEKTATKEECVKPWLSLRGRVDLTTQFAMSERAKASSRLQSLLGEGSTNYRVETTERNNKMAEGAAFSHVRPKNGLRQNRSSINAESSNELVTDDGENSHSGTKIVYRTVGGTRCTEPQRHPEIVLGSQAKSQIHDKSTAGTGVTKDDDQLSPKASTSISVQSLKTEAVNRLREGKAHNGGNAHDFREEDCQNSKTSSRGHGDNLLSTSKVTNSVLPDKTLMSVEHSASPQELPGSVDNPPSPQEARRREDQNIPFVSQGTSLFHARKSSTVTHCEIRRAPAPKTQYSKDAQMTSISVKNRREISPLHTTVATVRNDEGLPTARSIDLVSERSYLGQRLDHFCLSGGLPNEPQKSDDTLDDMMYIERVSKPTGCQRDMTSGRRIQELADETKRLAWIEKGGSHDGETWDKSSEGCQILEQDSYGERADTPTRSCDGTIHYSSQKAPLGSRHSAIDLVHGGRANTSVHLCESIIDDTSRKAPVGSRNSVIDLVHCGGRIEKFVRGASTPIDLVDLDRDTMETIDGSREVSDATGNVPESPLHDASGAEHHGKTASSPENGSLNRPSNLRTVTTCSQESVMQRKESEHGSHQYRDNETVHGRKRQSSGFSVGENHGRSEKRERNQCMTATSSNSISKVESRTSSAKAQTQIRTQSGEETNTNIDENTQIGSWNVESASDSYTLSMKSPVSSHARCRPVEPDASGETCGKITLSETPSISASPESITGVKRPEIYKCTSRQKKNKDQCTSGKMMDADILLGKAKDPEKTKTNAKEPTSFVNKGSILVARFPKDLRTATFGTNSSVDIDKQLTTSSPHTVNEKASQEGESSPFGSKHHVTSLSLTRDNQGSPPLLPPPPCDSSVLKVVEASVSGSRYAAVRFDDLQLDEPMEYRSKALEGFAVSHKPNSFMEEHLPVTYEGDAYPPSLGTQRQISGISLSQNITSLPSIRSCDIDLPPTESSYSVKSTSFRSHDERDEEPVRTRAAEEVEPGDSSVHAHQSYPPEPTTKTTGASTKYSSWMKDQDRLSESFAPQEGKSVPTIDCPDRGLPGVESSVSCSGMLTPIYSAKPQRVENAQIDRCDDSVIVLNALWSKVVFEIQSRYGQLGLPCGECIRPQQLIGNTSFASNDRSPNTVETQQFVHGTHEVRGETSNAEVDITECESVVSDAAICEVDSLTEQDLRMNRDFLPKVGGNVHMSLVDAASLSDEQDHESNQQIDHGYNQQIEPLSLSPSDRSILAAKEDQKAYLEAHADERNEINRKNSVVLWTRQTKSTENSSQNTSVTSSEEDPSSTASSTTSICSSRVLSSSSSSGGAGLGSSSGSSDETSEDGARRCDPPSSSYSMSPCSHCSGKPTLSSSSSGETQESEESEAQIRDPPSSASLSPHSSCSEEPSVNYSRTRSSALSSVCDEVVVLPEIDPKQEDPPVYSPPAHKRILSSPLHNTLLESMSPLLSLDSLDEEEVPEQTMEEESPEKQQPGCAEAFCGGLDFLQDKLCGMCKY